MLAALLVAAGATLTKLCACQLWVTGDVLELMAEHNYSWASSLEELECWTFEGDAVTLLASTLPRLPALRALNPHCFEYDEMIVRLLVLAEESGLPNLRTLVLDGVDEWIHEYDEDLAEELDYVDTRRMSSGALLLLALWLKPETKKGLRGQASAHLWDVQGLVQEHFPRAALETAVECLAQVKEAHACIGK